MLDLWAQGSHRSRYYLCLYVPGGAIVRMKLLAKKCKVNTANGGVNVFILCTLASAKSKALGAKGRICDVPSRYCVFV